MNERIRLLAEQAGYEKDMFGIGHWDMPECQKFALLIVRECIDVIGEDSYKMLTGVAYCTELKRHFGFEQ